jgi:hypothetical protein
MPNGIAWFIGNFLLAPVPPRVDFFRDLDLAINLPLNYIKPIKKRHKLKALFFVKCVGNLYFFTIKQKNLGG